jgi:hypothetical protein
VIKSVGRQVGTARCAVTARVQQAERILSDMRTTVAIAPLNAARTAQRDVRRAVPTPVVVSRCARAAM